MANPPKVLLVTGASRGIGAAVARLAAKRGYRVALGYKSARAEAESEARRITEEGGTARAFAADLTRPEEAARLVESVSADLGALDALVNNAALSTGRAGLLEGDAGDWRRMVDINLLGTLHCSRYVAQRMARSRGGSGGAIVNLSSDAARTGGNRIAVYAATKGAVNVLTVSLARELAGEGIRVNAVSPGIIDSGEHAAAGSAERAAAAAAIPMKRIGTPDEVARTVLWLLSDEASYVTGALLAVHGGR